MKSHEVDTHILDARDRKVGLENHTVTLAVSVPDQVAVDVAYKDYDHQIISAEARDLQINVTLPLNEFPQILTDQFYTEVVEENGVLTEDEFTKLDSEIRTLIAKKVAMRAMFGSPTISL